MGSRRIKVIILLLAAAALAATILLRPKSFRLDPTRYEKVPLTDPNGIPLYVGAVNRMGQMIACSSFRVTGFEPFYRIDPDGRTHVLPIPKESRVSPIAINDRGTIVGVVSRQNNSQDAFVWDSQRGFQLVPVRAAYPKADSEARKINNGGVIVGLWENKQAHSNGVFFYDPSEGVFDVEPLNGVSTTIRGLDEEGTIVGEYQSPSGHHAFLWSRQEGLVDLHSAIPHHVNSSALAINDNGWILIRFSGKDNKCRMVLYHQNFGTIPLCELKHEVFYANPVPSSDQFTVMEYRPSWSIRRHQIRPSEWNNLILEKDRKPILIDPKVLSDQQWQIVGIDDQGNIFGDTLGYRNANVRKPSGGFILRPIRPEKSVKK